MRFSRSVALAAGTATCVLLGLLGLQSAFQPDTPQSRLEAIDRLLTPTDAQESTDRNFTAARRALGQTPSVEALLDFLPGDHRLLSARLGAHELSYTAKFVQRSSDGSAGGSGGGSGSKIADKDGRPASDNFEIDDQLKLRWFPPSAGEEGPTFSLAQSNDAERSRELIRVSDQAYTRFKPRSWQRHQVDAELDELWLDDASRCVRDLVELAGDRLKLQTAKIHDGASGPFKIELSLAGATQKPGRVLPGPGNSEQSAQLRFSLTELKGHITIDPRTQMWSQADVALNYRLVDPEGQRRPFQGKVELSARLQKVPSGAARPTAPDAATDLPQRRRIEVERRRLLDGLAPS